MVTSARREWLAYQFITGSVVIISFAHFALTGGYNEWTQVSVPYVGFAFLCSIVGYAWELLSDRRPRTGRK